MFLGLAEWGDDMSNIADLIEDYILRRLAAEQNNHVELRRNDIADEISCAPSQISYVLNTRFTHEKGFLVESRRGLGGFIRILQVPSETTVYREMIDDLDLATEQEEVEAMVSYLLRHEMISSREAALLLQVIAGAFKTMEPEPRLQMIKSMLLTLEKFSD